MAAFCGCVGTKSNRDQAGKVTVGTSTNELVQIMGGPPTRVGFITDNGVVIPLSLSLSGLSTTGLESWEWQSTSASLRSVSFVIGDGKVLLVPGPPAISREDQIAQKVNWDAEVTALANARASERPKEQRVAELDELETLMKKEKEAREKYVASNPQLSDQIKECVLAQKICLGMPAAALVLSWGRPARSTMTVGNFGVRETWGYGDVLTGQTVFIENDKVTGWHESR